MRLCENEIFTECLSGHWVRRMSGFGRKSRGIV
jgi:hypothetical protein